MNPLFTDALIDEAAQALDAWEFPGEGWMGDSSSSFWRSLCRQRAEAVLGAVLPKIAKEVWYDGFEAGATWVQYIPPDIPHDPPLNPYD